MVRRVVGRDRGRRSRRVSVLASVVELGQRSDSFRPSGARSSHWNMFLGDVDSLNKTVIRRSVSRGSRPKGFLDRPPRDVADPRINDDVNRCSATYFFTSSSYVTKVVKLSGG
jgi:hypothetical protein